MSRASSSNRSIVMMDWQSTAEGETVLQHFYNPQTTGRKLFGILERPSILTQVEEVCYKLFFVGKSGIGKTATVARLAGTATPSSYIETVGIRKTNVYWPVKIWDKVILFKLQCWDAGDNTIRKYSHILPSCKEKVDALVFVFSYSDANSFSELPQLINKMTKDEPSQPASIVIGTRFSSTNKLEVDVAETKEFEQKWRVPVLRLGKSASSERNEVHKVAPLLNTICERLWMRDQEYLLRHGFTT
uniref:Ciliogenesis and planar polarity effector 2 n=1 Tax=Homalodisca liturata TaxID=320908 RepID=A0A1B6HEA4_9HEMI